MQEIRWHGRGGQGAKTVSQLLANINLGEGKFVQAFPEYGPERSGAPVKAYNRISDSQIQVHSGVYQPDIVVVIDSTLIHSENPTQGLKDEGILLVNSPKKPSEIQEMMGDNTKVITVDADRIAKEAGTGFANIPMLGALVKLLGSDLELVKKEIKKLMSKKLTNDIVDKNIRALEEGYKQIDHAS